MKVSVRIMDLCAWLAWAVSGVFAAIDTIEPGPPGAFAVWAIIGAAAAASLSSVAWVSRHIASYRDGMNDGLEAAGIIRLKDHV